MSASVRFHTPLTYSERATKAQYVAEKYREILQGRVLDVGADKCHLRHLVPAGTSYTGIGLGGETDLNVNLEAASIPFEDNSFDCVLCLDVLEHLDAIHAVFDELARVTRRYVIISLPNGYRDFLGMLFLQGDPTTAFKYYGLPVQRPDDRHKWFFSNSDAERFVREKAAKAGLNVVQVDSEGAGRPKTWKSAVKRGVLHVAALGLSVPATDLYHKTLWAVLEKQA